jgi:hypothetical protein
VYIAMTIGTHKGLYTASIISVDRSVYIASDIGMNRGLYRASIIGRVDASV